MENPAQLKSHTIKVDGVDLYYRAVGEGPVILLLHGYTLIGELWEPFVEELAAEHTLIIPDLPGHGNSSSFNEAPTFQKYAEVMSRFLEKLGVKKFDAIGHSAGAITLLYMAKQNSEMINSMILVGCGYKFSEDGLKFAKHDTFENLSEELKAFYRELHPRGDKQTKELYEQMMPILYSFSNFDIHVAQFKKMNTRTLIVMGDSDYYFKPEYALEMHRAFPNSQLWIISGQGHLPFREDWGGSASVQKIFAEVVLEFIDSGQKQNTLGLN